jgi:hypothetical protein
MLLLLLEKTDRNWGETIDGSMLELESAAPAAHGKQSRLVLTTGLGRHLAKHGGVRVYLERRPLATPLGRIQSAQAQPNSRLYSRVCARRAS